MADNVNGNDPKSILMIPGVIAGLSVFLAIYLIVAQIVPNIQSYVSAQAEYKNNLQIYSEKEKKLETLKEANTPVAGVTASEAVEKQFFKPLESGVDSESVIAAEFNEILTLMTSNAIKTRSVKYTYDPQDDNFVKGAADKYSVCKLDMSMIASYNNFKNFLKDLYKHDHYLDIAKIEIVPYQKNKSVLLIELQLKLYAEKV